MADTASFNLFSDHHLNYQYIKHIMKSSIHQGYLRVSCDKQLFIVTWLASLSLLLVSKTNCHPIFHLLAWMCNLHCLWSGMFQVSVLLICACLWIARQKDVAAFVDLCFGFLKVLQKQIMWIWIQIMSDLNKEGKVQYNLKRSRWKHLSIVCIFGIYVCLIFHIACWLVSACCADF